MVQQTLVEELESSTLELQVTQATTNIELSFSDDDYRLYVKSKLVRSLAEALIESVEVVATEYGDRIHYTATVQVWRPQAYDRFQKRLRTELQGLAKDQDDSVVTYTHIYEDALGKAVSGRHFKNPCEEGALEHTAWEEGTQKGTEIRESILSEAAEFNESQTTKAP